MASEQGALPPPEGTTPNFTNPKNRNALIYTLTVVFMAINTICVAARTYTRFFLIRRRGWQDYMLLVAWFVSIIYIIMMPLGIEYGLGIHQWDVTKAQYAEFAKRVNIIDVLYSPVMCLVKLAILVQLGGIFAPFKSRMYFFICGLSTLTVMFYVACMLFHIFACVPRRKIWDPSTPGTCINSSAGMSSSAVLNTILDFVLLAIPLNGIWRLQMPLRKKWQVSAVFATGLFGCVSSIMRLVSSVNLIQSGDKTFKVITVGVWCIAEITGGIVCCCLPVLPQFYRRHMSSFVSSLRTRLRSTVSNTRDTDKNVSRGSSGMNGSSNKVPRHFSRERNDYLELHDGMSKRPDSVIGIKEVANRV